MHISLMPIYRMVHQKIEMYKRFRGIAALEEVEELQDEMIDRFGDYPEEVGYLFKLPKLRCLHEMNRIEFIKQIKQEITFFLGKKPAKI